MATANKSNENTIYTQVGDERFELTGAELELYLADRAAEQLLENEQTAKKQIRESAIRQLAETANLSEEQIEALLG